MAYDLVETTNGQFAVDWDVIWRILRNYCRAGNQLDCARVVRESQTTANPMTWGLPDLQYVDVDWDKVRQDTQTEMLARSMQIVKDFERSADSVAYQLKAMISETGRLQDRFHNFMKMVSQDAYREIEKSVATYGSIVEGLKWVRDLSATILVGLGTGGVGAGAAVLGTGAGTLIKTVGKYEDTGSVGLATVEAATGVVFTFIPAARGVSVSGGMKVVKAVISASADTYRGVLEGKPLGQSIMNGSLQLASPAVGELAKSDLVRGILAKTAVPVMTQLLGSTPGIEQLTGSVASKVSEELFKKGGKAVIGWAMSGPKASQPSDGTSELADYLTFEDDALVKLAIVDMAKGVARSTW
jgi:hypothetical protein